MSEHPLHRRYRDWPPALQEREDLARDLFGEHLVAAYDNWLATAAQMLFEGYRYKSPSEDQRRFLDWITTLDQREKECALAFVRDILTGGIFSILVTIDGAAGHFLQEDVMERLRVLVEIFSRETDEEHPPVETLRINTAASQQNRGIELHEEWYGWLERFSRWGRRP
jgi:hypothetical protein